MPNRTEREWNDPQFPKDITRLENLLKQYRDYMITRYCAFHPYIEPHLVIDLIDKAISVLRGTL